MNLILNKLLIPYACVALIDSTGAEHTWAGMFALFCACCKEGQW